jgi:hypothetical protein
VSLGDNRPRSNSILVVPLPDYGDEDEDEDGREEIDASSRLLILRERPLDG